MATILSKLKPQALALNALAFLLVVVIACFGGSWQAVVSLYAVLGALCFLWTRPVAGSVEKKKLDDLEEKLEKGMKEVHARVGILGAKIGLKGQ